LKNVRVQAYLNHLQDKYRKTAGITLTRWLEEQKSLGFSRITDYLSFGPDGLSLLDSKQIPEEALRAISEITETVTAQGGSVKFKLHDKQAALRSIGQHMGWIKDKPCEPGDVKPLVIINQQMVVIEGGAAAPDAPTSSQRPIIDIGGR
jgi:phage terminase small subunit